MKRHRLDLIVCAGLLASWLAYALAGQPISRAVAGRFGGAILRLGQGKIDDPALFIQYRLREALWLATLALLWVAGHGLLDRLIRGRVGRSRGLVHGVAAWVCLNLWTGAACHTALFWSAMRVGAGVQSLAQFHFKRILLEENRAPHLAAVVGSSQSRAQIHEEQLNQQLGTNLWTTELTYPGVRAYDLLLVERQLRRARLQLVICYVSEGDFYTSHSGSVVVPDFLQFQDIPDGWRRNGLRYLSGRGICFGLLGDLLPFFHCREVLAQRLLGPAIINLKQEQYDNSLPSDLAARARNVAPGFRLSPEAGFEKQAFEDFVARCQQANRRVVVLVGSLNPILARQIDPAVRADLTNFLNQLPGRYPAVVLVQPGELPQQTPADYLDLTHVNTNMQSRFTADLACRLARLLTPEQPQR